MFYLYNDDCINIMQKMIQNGEKVDVIFTDPPYEFISKNPRGGGFMTNENKKYLEAVKNTFGMTYNPTEFLELSAQIMIKPCLYVFTNKNLLKEYLSFAKQKKWAYDVLICRKTNPIPTYNGHYMPDKEYLIYMSKGAYFNKSLGYENYKTVFDCVIGGKNRFHPTQKPLDLVLRSLKISAKPNALIFDPYMGSGTTGVACKKLNLHFIGIEINKEYYNVAKKRIEETDV